MFIALVSGAALIAAALAPGRLEAQYFGRNKVVYETFDFREMHTRHFDIYYYPAESAATGCVKTMRKPLGWTRIVCISKGDCPV